MRSGLELRWLAQEPRLAADRIGARLLVPPAADAITLDGGAVRFVRDPDVRAEGRLALVPAGTDDGPAGALGPRVRAGLRVTALGWATVDTDRTAHAFAAALDVADPGEPAAPDLLLGATVRVIRDPRLPGGRVALLEPSSEGRLAATLARDGEGPCALYLTPREGLEAWLTSARAGGVAVSRADVGPFGRGSLVLGGPVAGPHLVVVERGPTAG